MCWRFDVQQAFGTCCRSSIIGSKWLTSAVEAKARLQVTYKEPAAIFGHPRTPLACVLIGLVACMVMALADQTSNRM